MASPYLHARFEPRLYERVLRAVESEGLSLSAFLRVAVEEHLGTIEREAAERAELLAEARRFLAIGPGETAVDRDAHRLVERYVSSLESAAGRIGAAEQRGRARALAEVAAGALQSLDGEVVTFDDFTPDSPAVALETTAVRRGFLREHLARSRARALLQAPPPPSPPPSASALLGEARTRELWLQATRGALRPAWGFCAQHGMVPLAETMDGRRHCYLGCSVSTRPEVA